MATAATSETAVNGSRDEEKATVSFGRDQLKAFIERIERLRRKRRRSATISAMSMPRLKEQASTSRRCVRSCACASRTSTSARSRRR